MPSEKEQIGENLLEYTIISTTATEYASDGISCTSRNPPNIKIFESVLKEGSEEEKVLQKN